MKIGLLSVQNHNYGSILQAYALQSCLQELDHKTEIIRYKKTNYFKQAARLLYFPLLKATFLAKWKSLYLKFRKQEVYSDVILTRERAFSDFAKNNFAYSRVYIGRDDLISGTCEYDCFVLGSDQVWNPMNIGGDFFTMTFIPDYIRKITYAPSFGVSEIPIKQRTKTAAYLNRIDYISVRETQAVAIVKELTGRNVPQVVDPTILVGRELWDARKGNRLIKEDYIFCYFISANLSCREFAKGLSKKTGLKLVTIPYIDEYVKADDGFGDIIPKSVGPFEFVNIISNAKYVCTDSFHGSVFSVLYEIPFFTFSRYKKETGDSTNSRLYSFLNMVGMKSRLRSERDSIEKEELVGVDFSEAKAILDLGRRESLQYLKHALDD